MDPRDTLKIGLSIIQIPEIIAKLTETPNMSAITGVATYTPPLTRSCPAKGIQCVLTMNTLTQNRQQRLERRVVIIK